MTLFDYMVSSRENNMLKAFLPYVDRDFQPMLATYIKYTEFLATIDLFSKKGRNVFTSKIKASGFSDIIASMLPYVSNKDRETFETINNIKNAMEMFETYKDMMSSDMMDSFDGFSSMFNTSCDETPDNEDCSNNENKNENMQEDSMSNMFSSMLSPEQMLMFEQLSGMMNSP